VEDASLAGDVRDQPLQRFDPSFLGWSPAKTNGEPRNRQVDAGSFCVAEAFSLRRFDLDLLEHVGPGTAPASIVGSMRLRHRQQPPDPTTHRRPSISTIGRI
jgi:hypothetical protein